MSFVSTRIVRIEWGDCDAADMVFYPRYFAIFNECTVRMFEAAGFGLREMLARFDVSGIPMVETRARFVRPSRFGDDLRILSRVTEIRRSSFDVHHAAYLGDDLSLEGFETRVWVRAAPDRPGGLAAVNIPAEVRDILAPKGERAPRA